MTGADLALLVNEAALFAARRDHETIQQARLHRRDREDRARRRAPGRDVARRPRAHRLPRGRARARRHAHPGRRPRPQGLDHPARAGARRDALHARGRQVRLRARRAARPDPRDARRPRRREGRLRRDHDGRRVRHPAAHADRPQHGRALGDERRDRRGRRRARRRRRARCCPASRRPPSTPSGWSTRRSGGSSTRPSARRSSCSSASATRLESLAQALLERETLDQDEAYAAAGVEPVMPAAPVA